MNEYLETLRIQAAAGDEDSVIQLDLLSAQLEQENQRAIAWAEQRGWNWRVVGGRVQCSNVPFDVPLQHPPKDWTQVVEVDSCPTFDRLHFIDGSTTTTKSGFIKVGAMARVRRRRIEVQNSRL